MKLQIFYDDGRQMDILLMEAAYPTWIGQATAYLKKQGIKIKAAVHGVQVWGWTKTYDVHVYTNEVSDSELEICKGLYPRGIYKIEGGAKVKRYK